MKIRIPSRSTVGFESRRPPQSQVVAMSKPRNYHCLNAIQRKAGFHSGRRRPDYDDTLEQLESVHALECDMDADCTCGTYDDKCPKTIS